jgi:outer membrane protein assembly factor BamB
MTSGWPTYKGLPHLKGLTQLRELGLNGTKVTDKGKKGRTMICRAPWFLTLVILWLLVASFPTRGADWPEWRGSLRDGVWREDGILERFPTKGLPVRWRTPIGPGFSGPAVARGRVFLMDRTLDEGAQTDVKTQWNYRDRTTGRERVLCLEEATGRILWTHSYPCTYSVAYGSGPRATPTVHSDKVYTQGTMGDLCCLDTATGRVVWQRNFVREWGAEVPLYGCASPPLVDGDRLIAMLGHEGSAVLALDRHTGRPLWEAGRGSEPGYCTPLIRTLGGKRQLVVWHAEALEGLEPSTGKVLWSIPHHLMSGMAISTPAFEGNRLAISTQFEGTLMLKFAPGADSPQVVWKASAGSVPERRWKEQGFNTTMSPVLLLKDYVYGVSLYGETCCLDSNTGRRVWTTLQPTSGGTLPRERWSTLFMVPHGDRVFIFDEKGDLILARLTSAGYDEISRTHVIDPDMPSSGEGGRKVVWSHPAFANRCVYARNNHEILCVSLAVPSR